MGSAKHGFMCYPPLSVHCYASATLKDILSTKRCRNVIDYPQAVQPAPHFENLERCLWELTACKFTKWTHKYPTRSAFVCVYAFRSHRSVSLTGTHGCGAGFDNGPLSCMMDSGLVGSTDLHSSHSQEGYHESRRCSRDTYPESYITK